MEEAALKAGMIVFNRLKPEWGPGKIIQVEGQFYHVFWRDRPGLETTLMTAAGVARASSQDGTEFDGLPKFVRAGNVFAVKGERLSLDAAIGRFRRFFSLDFDDPVYWKQERAYKEKAHKHYQDVLGGGKLHGLLMQDLARLVEETNRVVGKVNLLFSVEQAAFRDALKDAQAARAYFERLDALLQAPKVTEDVYAPYAKAVRDLPADRGRVASWPVATLLPFLAQPDRHMFLKPSVTQVAALALGVNLNYRAEPNWLTYSSLLHLAADYKEKLSPLRPRDLIDVQSFFWVVGRYQ
jgi:hypothetical protein